MLSYRSQEADIGLWPMDGISKILKMYHKTLSKQHLRIKEILSHLTPPWSKETSNYDKYGIIRVSNYHHRYRVDLCYHVVCKVVKSKFNLEIKECLSPTHCAEIILFRSKPIK